MVLISLAVAIGINVAPLTTSSIARMVRDNKGNQAFEYKVNKHNIFWPVPNSAITANNKADLRQNFGYDGYSDQIPYVDNWEEAVADEGGSN